MAKGHPKVLDSDGNEIKISRKPGRVYSINRRGKILSSNRRKERKVEANINFDYDKDKWYFFDKSGTLRSANRKKREK